MAPMLTLLALLATVPPDVPKGTDATRDAELAKLATPIVDAPMDFDAHIAGKGPAYVFVSTRDGLPQLYAGDLGKPDDAPKRLVTGTERTSGIRLSPDGKTVYFRMDHGSDENWRIYSLPVAGGTPKELTPGEEMQRDVPFVPEKAPKMLVYSARRRADKTFSVFVDNKVVYTDPSPGFLEDVSLDGKHAVFVRSMSTSDTILFSLDLGAGKATRLYPPEGKEVRIHDVALSRDGSRVYVATDEGSEREVLLALELKTGKEVARIVSMPPTAGIDGGRIAKKGNTLAYRVDAGNHTEIWLLDGTTLARKAKVDLPLGSGGNGDFSDDGKKLTIAWSTASTPPALYVVDVATGKAAPLRKAILDLPPVDASIVEVQSFDSIKVPVNVYLPPGAKGKLPVIVSVHGGPAGASSVRWSPITRFFLAQGYAVVEPNVRGSSGFGRAYEMADDGKKRLDGIHDLEIVGRWAIKQPWADPKRLVILGGSYGGYSVLMGLTRHPDLWKAGVDLFGVSSARLLLKRTTGWIQAVFVREFGDPDKDAAFLDSISPINDVAKIRAPLFVYAGENDPRVPRPESDAIVSALRQRKVPVEYMVAPNEGHSMDRRDNKIAFLSRVARFLEKSLK
jgi:dipeptidyl aminopeptidase/acylaminoacyl peptidase